MAALFIACLFTACLAAKLDISQFLQSVADDLPRGDTRIHRAYVARIVLPKSGASTSYPPLSAVQTQLFSSSHNAVTGDYVPPQHKVPEGHPHPPPKPKPVPFPGPTDLELKTILEQLRPGSLSRSEIHGHKNEVEGGEFLVEGSRVWVGRKAWVVREWDRGTTKRWSEDDWMTGKAAAEGAKRGEEHQGEEEERGAVALGVSSCLVVTDDRTC